MEKFTKRRKSDYSRGTKWGRKTIKEAYREDGKVGLSRCDKSAITCKNYGTNRKIKKNKKGTALTEPLRAYYRGIANGMLLGYNDLFYNNSPTVSQKKKTAKRPIYDAMNDFDYTESGRIKGSYVDGRFEPDNDVADLLVPHFASRFKDIPFAIHDLKRNKLIMHANGKTQTIIPNFPIAIVLGKHEENFDNLWKTYYDSVTITERVNPKLMYSFMPARYHKHMNEKRLKIS